MDAESSKFCINLVNKHDFNWVVAWFFSGVSFMPVTKITAFNGAKQQILQLLNTWTEHMERISEANSIQANKSGFFKTSLSFGGLHFFLY